MANKGALRLTSDNLVTRGVTYENGNLSTVRGSSNRQVYDLSSPESGALLFNRVRDGGLAIKGYADCLNRINRWKVVSVDTQTTSEWVFEVDCTGLLLMNWAAIREEVGVRARVWKLKSDLANVKAGGYVAHIDKKPRSDVPRSLRPYVSGEYHGSKLSRDDFCVYAGCHVLKSEPVGELHVEDRDVALVRTVNLTGGSELEEVKA
jgi:hypothetical protein